MTIEEKCREVAGEVLPDFTFVLADWYDADRIISKSEMPIVLRVLPVGGTLEIRNGRSVDNENSAIAFLDVVPKDATGEENAAVYNRMKAAAVKYADALGKSGWFEPFAEPIPYTVIYEQLSSIVTGVMLDVVLKEMPQCL